MSRFGKKHCGNVGRKPNFRRRLLWSECRADCGVVTPSSYFPSFLQFFTPLVVCRNSYRLLWNELDFHGIKRIFGLDQNFLDFPGIKWSDWLPICSWISTDFYTELYGLVSAVKSAINGDNGLRGGAANSQVSFPTFCCIINIFRLYSEIWDRQILSKTRRCTTVWDSDGHRAIPCKRDLYS